MRELVGWIEELDELDECRAEREALRVENEALRAALSTESKLHTEIERMRPVVEASEAWRAARYPQTRSWHADPVDAPLVSAVDTYHTRKP